AAARLAAAAGRPPLQMEAATWTRQPALAAACRYAGWLPVLTLELGPGERHVLPEHPALAVPMLLVGGRDGAIEASALIEIDLPPLSAQERREAWREALASEDGDGSPCLDEDRLCSFAEHALLDGPSVRTLAGRMRLDARVRGEAPGLGHLRRARAGFG
ncbi:ATPase AAA, partial [Thauera aminoaromatica S2]